MPDKPVLIMVVSTLASRHDNMSSVVQGTITGAKNKAILKIMRNMNSSADKERFHLTLLL